ncbi:hypothetical protein VE03_00725 [Pseudogymnoascus sp. 23342-1-I1]|nr:hypothetical protein VE03_00725 [Pseudogymnoascus sp. 23342-1-I1]
MELWPPGLGMKHYTAEMLSEWGGQPQVALSATSNLWVITGPSGAGKSRVGKYLRDRLGLIFIEGDDFLTANERANNGIVDDERHAELLNAIINEALIQAVHGNADVVVACSALRIADRNAWRDGVSIANTIGISPREYQPPYTPSYEDFTRPNLHGDLHPLDNQDPYLQGIQDPYPHTIADDGFAYHTAPPTALDTPGTALRPIHLQFVVLAISKKVSLKTVKSRQERTGHFVSEAAVPAQFAILQPPEEWEIDCFRQKSLKAPELTVAVEKHVVRVASGKRDCMCMLCNL